MPGTTPPRLTSLSFPHTVSLLGGSQTNTFTAGATDDSGGVEGIVINFSATLSTVFMYGSAASWTAGAATAQDAIAVSTPPGVYSIASVDVYDNAGNELIYSTSVLQNLGIATSIRPCVLQRKVTNGYRAMWAAHDLFQRRSYS